jgi:CO/xanthine dehydrogenase FAD-binding subunit
MSAYYRPETLRGALDFLFANSSEITVLAGGTDLFPARSARLVREAHKPEHILDISAIAELRGIADRGDYWWIGATSTWSDIIAADLPPLFDALKSAARQIGGVQIQNRGTIAGNLCTSSPAGDSIPCLLAFDAEVECVEGTVFRVPMTIFQTGYRTTVLDGEIVTGIRVPKQNGRGYFRKLGARHSLVISIAMVAAVFDWDERGNVKTARVVVGACSPVAQRLSALENDLRGKPLDPALVKPEHVAMLTPIDDIRASAEYRRAAALQLVKDVIAEAAEDQGGGCV